MAWLPWQPHENEEAGLKLGRLNPGQRGKQRGAAVGCAGGRRLPERMQAEIFKPVGTHGCERQYSNNSIEGGRLRFESKHLSASEESIRKNTEQKR